MEKIAESPMDPKSAASLPGAIGDGLKLLALNPNSTPLQIVEAVDSFTFNWQKQIRPKSLTIRPEDLPFALGPLWAQQLIRSFQWQWIKVTFLDRKNSVATGIASPDRSLIIYPFHFLIGCLRDPGVDCTILLAFNMLLANKIPPTTPNEYLNLMQAVRRIVPRT